MVKEQLDNRLLNTHLVWPVPPKSLMGLNELFTSDRAAHRKFSGKDGGRDNLCEFGRAAAACTTKHFQTLPAGSQSGASAHRRHSERGQGDARVKIAVPRHFEVG